MKESGSRAGSSVRCLNQNKDATEIHCPQDKCRWIAGIDATRGTEDTEINR